MWCIVMLCYYGFNFINLLLEDLEVFLVVGQDELIDGGWDSLLAIFDLVIQTLCLKIIL